MTERIDLGSGLELLMVDSVGYGGSDAVIREIIRQGVDLQQKVFEEQGVSRAKDRVLEYKESVGTEKEPGSLNEGTPYWHLYVVAEGKPIAMMASGKIKVKARGEAILDYFPPLVLFEWQDRKIRVQSGNFGEKDMTPTELMLYMSFLIVGFTANRFTDGIGMPAKQLKQNYGSVCEIKVPVPSMLAEQPEEYNQILDDVPIYGLFPDVFIPGVFLPMLGRAAAHSLLTRRYLIDGYYNEGARGRIEGTTTRIRDTAPVVELERRISHAVADHGGVAFLRMQ